MAKTPYAATFAHAPTLDGRAIQLGNGAMVYDTLDGIGSQEAVKVKVDAYFSKRGIGYLISHLQDIKDRLVDNG